MREFSIALAATTALISGALWLGSAQAAPITQARAAVDRSTMIEAAHMWGGESYCWYDNGWKGPGWYLCGYAKRRGYGWGGPHGWHGWGMGPYRMRRHHHMMGGGCCW